MTEAMSSTTDSNPPPRPPPWAPPPEPELDPIGLELWLKLLFSIAAVILGVWLAAQAGFQQTARFNLAQDLRAASNALNLVLDEMQDNAGRIRGAIEGLDKGQSELELHVSQSYFDAAIDKSSMALVQPGLLMAIDQFYGAELSRAAKLFSGKRRLSSHDREFAVGAFKRSLDSIDQILLPALQQQLVLLGRNLQALESE